MSELGPVERRFGRTQKPAAASRPVRLEAAPRVIPLPRGAQIEALSERRRASLALHNLRGAAIVGLLFLHCSLAYLASTPQQTSGFNQPPYMWVAFPIVDAHRWLGLDIICAWQDVYLMCLMFFLSGLFVVSAITRDGTARFLLRRAVRLGAPFGLGVLVILPIALYPVYRMTAPEGGLIGYLHAYLKLPFAPSGPMWFLALLFAFTLLGAVVFRYARPLVDFVARFSVTFEQRPLHGFCLWAGVTILAYAPLALTFTPWRWENWGPFALQLCRPALYAAYYFAGLGVGAAGLGSGMLRADGVLAKTWRRWMGAAAASLLTWMGLTGLTLQFGDATPFLLRLISAASYAMACECSILFLLGLSLRFGTRRPWPLLSVFSDNAFGIYILHYIPVVWLQYALLGFNWPAPVKAITVMVGTSVACVAALTISSSLTKAGRKRPAGQDSAA